MNKKFWRAISAVLFCRVARLINKEGAVKKYCQKVIKYKERLIKKIDEVLKQITPEKLANSVHFVKIDENCFMTPCPIPPDPDDGIDDWMKVGLRFNSYTDEWKIVAINSDYQIFGDWDFGWILIEDLAYLLDVLKETNPKAK
jgi:hypothetical protein